MSRPSERRPADSGLTSHPKICTRTCRAFNTVITGGQTINSRRSYTLYAMWNEATQGWKAVGYETLGVMCQ